MSSPSEVRPPWVKELSRPGQMAVSHIIEALGDTVPFTYEGSTSQFFRGLTTQSSGRDPRRRFWVMPDMYWTHNNVDPYRRSDRKPEQDISNALLNGAEGIICPDSYRGHPALNDTNVFFTAHTLDFAYRVIEAQRRLTRGRRMVAVTGSAGKSTTCAMLAHALRISEKDQTVQQSNSNRNRIHEVLAQQSRGHRYARTVLEVAGSAFSSDRRDFSVSADVSIITSISEAHLNYLGDLAGVARYKSDIFKRPPRDGAAVVNIDAPYSDILANRAREEGAKLITYGESSDADIRLIDYDPIRGRVQANVVGLDVEYTLAPKGKHMALNSLAVLAALRELGMDWATGMTSLATFVAPRGRGQEVQVPTKDGGNFTLIDGSYNANPASVRASLQNLAESSPRGRKVAVLGDILELGAEADEIHQSLVNTIRKAGLDSLHLLGDHFLRLHDREPTLADEVHRWSHIDHLIAELPGTLYDGDLVLIKGSGSTGLKQLAASFIDLAKTGAS